MGIFEYLFERKNPGKVGSIQKKRQSIKRASIPIILLKLLVSTFIVYGLFYITVLQNYSFINMMIFIFILFGYCSLSYYYVPRPDTSNIGLLGGMVDHPFRFTDDLNRILMVLLVLMYPGRFIATTLIQIFMLFNINGQK